MRKTALPIFLSLTALTTLSLIYLHQVTSVKSAAATNIVISEIMVRGSSANDEFIELYEKEVYAPFCFIILSDLHFLEKEALESLGE